MNRSIKNQLESAREEAAFWREFSQAGARRFATDQMARLIAVRGLAERKLADLERVASRYEASKGKVIGGWLD